MAVSGGWLLTPTGRSLSDLEADGLSLLDASWSLVSGNAPTKEHPLHAAIYAARPSCAAIVHLHSTHAVAVSCLLGLDPLDALPPVTPYQVMRLGRTALVPYRPPGSQRLADEVRSRPADHDSLLLANHGPVVMGQSLGQAVEAAEEMEEAARLFLLLDGRGHRRLSAPEVAELRSRFSRREGSG